MNLYIAIIITKLDNIQKINFNNYSFFTNIKTTIENVVYINDISHFSILQWIKDNNLLTDFIFICYEDTFIYLSNLIKYITTINPLIPQYIGGHGDFRELSGKKFYFHSHSPGIILTKSLIESLLSKNINFMDEYNILCKDLKHLYNCSGVAIGYYVDKYNYNIVKNDNIWYCNYHGYPCHHNIPNKDTLISCSNMSIDDFQNYNIYLNNLMNIYICPSGGLGNILFQYFIGCALKKKYNCNIYYSINYNYWRGDINKYSIFQHLNFIDLNNNNIIAKTYNEENSYYNEINLNVKFNYIINGYFQSYKYFINVIDIIKNDLFINHNNNLYNEIINIYNNIKTNKETCLLHVRRGDYLQYPLIHPICSNEYYITAINYISNCKYLVFSDDIDFLKSWKILNNLDYIIIDEIDPEKTLILMSLCDNFIIANSTLSLSAYYLRKNINAKLTAPRKWFGLNGYSFKIEDIVPPSAYII